jgi:glycerol-3-phosphate dehydrogenase
MSAHITSVTSSSTQGWRRDQTWQALQGPATWDVCVVGGGATGLGVALDAAARGYSVVLAEAEDFASGASSRSSKMLHGGVRYLQQLDFALVKEALDERATILANAPHVAQVLPFVIPCGSLAHAAFYGSGLKLYDLLAGRRNVGRSHYLSSQEIQAQAGALRAHAHGIQYHDGLFDDARLAQSIARSARERGAVLMNYCCAEFKGQADQDADLIALTRKDTAAQHIVRARCTIFATGAWSGERVAVSRGSHIVLNDIGLSSGVLLPKTPDGRVLYLLPWLGHTLIGTTDVSVSRPNYVHQAPQEDIAWLLKTASQVLRKPLEAQQVTASFVGYRPLVRVSQTGKRSSQLSRAHLVERVSARSLRVVGGKWTTYRRMAQDALDAAIAHGLLPKAMPCSTAQLMLSPNPVLDNAWLTQGQWSEDQLQKIVQSAVQDEAACHAEDILYRRLRTGFTDQALAQALQPQIEKWLALSAG